MARSLQSVSIMDSQFVLLCLASMAVTGVLSTFNAARYKPANQSSLYNVNTAAEKAVDGNYDPVFRNYSCASTRVNDPTPWWRVDLGREYRVTSVRITNRLIAGYRLHDITITVVKETSATPTVCGQYPGAVPDGANVTVTCSKPTLGRYVKISKPALNDLDILTLCEVDVMVVNRTRMAFQRLVGQKIQESGTVSIETTLPDCVHACLHSDSCVAVNYSRGSSQCQLLTTAAHSDAITDHEWSLYVVMS